MDAPTQRRVLGLAVGMAAAYALSALLFALGFATRQKAFFVAAIVAGAAALTLSTLIRPVALGMRRWWLDASTGRRTVNVAFAALRVGVVVVAGWAALTFSLR